MAALVRTAANLRAILAAHVPFQLLDRRRLGSAHNVQGDGVVYIAAEAADFEIEESSVEGVAKSG
jgi:hypothetical protein